MADTPTTVVVATQSAWQSKINWTQLVSGGAAVLVYVTGGKVSIPTEVQLTLVTAIGAIGTVTTWVMRTWFTKTVTPSSVSAATTIGSVAGIAKIT